MLEVLQALINKVRDFGIEKVFGRYYSVYPAQVTSNEDETGRGLIEVKIPGLFGEKAHPFKAEPRDFRGAGKQKGEFHPPDVDDWVNVEFRNGDQRFPIYSGGWFGEGELSEEFPYEGNVPTARGFQNKYGHVFKFVEAKGREQVVFATPAGHYFVLDDTAGKEAVYLIHKSGAQLQIDKDGSAKMLAADGGFLNLDAVEGTATLTAKSGSYLSIGEDGLTFSDPSGQVLATITKDGVTMTSAKGIVLKGDKIALGGGALSVELVDQTIQALDAFITSPSLVTTGTGPSSPLMPPAMTKLMQIKMLLTLIKGSLP